MTTPHIDPKPSQEKTIITTEIHENKRVNDVYTLDLPEPGTPERFEAERRLVRKLDRRLLPTVIVIYLMNYIDRNGITTARLKGLQEDLGITDIQYDTVLAIFYASYCPGQIVSNVLLNYLPRPSLYIGICAVLWGLNSALTGVTTNFGGILTCRVFIGLPEAALYPGILYLLSRWYTKKELAFRTSIFFGGQLIANAFGALIAAGILANMEGKRGIRAWRWLFFLEGSITVFIGFASIWLLPDYPHNTPWLSRYERRLALARIYDDGGQADQDHAEDSPLKGLKMAISDPLVLIFTIQTVSQILSLSFTNFFPTLTQTLGFSTPITLLLAGPPWVFATIVCCLSGWHADRTGERFFHITSWWWVSIVGFIIGLSTMKIPARYVAMFLMAFGYAGLTTHYVWLSNTVPRPPAYEVYKNVIVNFSERDRIDRKRAAALGIVTGVGHLGALVGSYAWKAAWGPEYHQSMAISIAALVFNIFIAFVIRQMLIHKNKKLTIEETTRLQGLTLKQVAERRKGYLYLY